MTPQLDDLEKIEALCDRYERELQKGQTASIEQYMRMVSQHLKAGLLQELLLKTLVTSSPVFARILKSR